MLTVRANSKTYAVWLAYSSALKMEAVRSSETSENFYQTAGRLFIVIALMSPSQF
jgi:hypothetical protein